jgi:hypothetical protein
MLLFTNAYFAGDTRADMNHDGAVNSIDMYAYTNDYLAGCAHR